jgi:hypothetical protein
MSETSEKSITPSTNRRIITRTIMQRRHNTIIEECDKKYVI